MAWLPIAALVLLLVSGAPDARAVTGFDVAPPPSGDSAYDQGVAAYAREDWPAMIEHLSRVIDERPWDDDAHSLIGFAYRQQGQWDLSLMHYNRALALNPHHRGALEYLGEAYLQLDRPGDAEAIRERLEQACRRVYTAQDWPAQCEEWQDLEAAFEDYRAAR